MCYKLGWYINKSGNMDYGYIYPYQLWLPFEHLDFLIGNIKRNEEVMWRSTQ